MAKRLLLVLTEFPPSFGGMQTHALAFSRWLHERGYHVEVATYRLEEGPVELPELPFPVHRVLSRVAYQANIRKLTQLATLSRADLIYSSTVYYGELRERTNTPVFCRSAGNDVLRPWIAWPFSFASGVLDLPWVERQLFRRWKRWQWPERLESLMLARRSALMKRSARSMERIFANSDFTRGLLEEAEVALERVVTLPGGVDAQYFAGAKRSREGLGLDAGEFYLLTACRLVEKKGLDTLLDAIAILRQKDIPMQLRIAGEGRQRRLIEERIAQLSLGDRVQLLGYVPHETLRDYMHACDAFVLSSREVVDARSGLRDAETMGRALCEAAACGMPMVSTVSGGIPSVIEHGVDGLLAKPGCSTDLAAKIEAVWSDRRMGLQLGEKARKKAISRFDWRILFDAHEQAIEEILAKRLKQDFAVSR
jgi:phosphatidylinositol alpha-1,6-mannosyltransferase